jgi:hypothetical protein
MIILTGKKKIKENSGWLININLGEVGFAVDAVTKEEAIRIALDRAWETISRGTCSINMPKVVKVNGEPYNVPHSSVRIANHID